MGPETRWTEIELGTIQGKSRDLKFSLYCLEEENKKMDLIVLLVA